MGLLLLCKRTSGDTVEESNQHSIWGAEHYFHTEESWKKFIGAEDETIGFGGRDAELYFEEDDFDTFLEHLKGMKEIKYVHPAVEHSWGQRAVCRRFLESGMTDEEVAVRMDVPMKFVNTCKK